jgi:prepilin-type N-terminal cleavage/methylation domain-containing protein
MQWAGFGRSNRGFSLVEVLFAMAILTTIALGVAQLFAVATKANLGAKGQTSTALMATQKMEQLRGLTWGFDTSGMGLPLSDTTTDLTVDPPTNGGAGLNPSPGGTMQANTAGFVDFLDQYGNWVGTGSTPPATAVYIRRWSIEPLPTNPNNTLILQVLVTKVVTEQLRAAGAGAGGARWRLHDDAWLVTVRTRKSQ